MEILLTEKARLVKEESDRKLKEIEKQLLENRMKELQENEKRWEIVNQQIENERKKQLMRDEENNRKKSELISKIPIVKPLKRATFDLDSMKNESVYSFRPSQLKTSQPIPLQISHQPNPYLQSDDYKKFIDFYMNQQKPDNELPTSFQYQMIENQNNYENDDDENDDDDMSISERFKLNKDTMSISTRKSMKDRPMITDRKSHRSSSQSSNLSRVSNDSRMSTTLDPTSNGTLNQLAWNFMSVVTGTTPYPLTEELGEGLRIHNWYPVVSVELNNEFYLVKQTKITVDDQYITFVFTPYTPEFILNQTTFDIPTYFKHDKTKYTFEDYIPEYRQWYEIEQKSYDESEESSNKIIAEIFAEGDEAEANLFRKYNILNLMYGEDSDYVKKYLVSIKDDRETMRSFFEQYAGTFDIGIYYVLRIMVMLEVSTTDFIECAMNNRWIRAVLGYNLTNTRIQKMKFYYAHGVLQINSEEDNIIGFTIINLKRAILGFKDPFVLNNIYKIAQLTEKQQKKIDQMKIAFYDEIRRNDPLSTVPEYVEDVYTDDEGSVAHSNVFDDL